MATIRLDESKYSLESRLIKASINVKKLLETFNERISHWGTTKNLNLFARTHISGLTYFVTPRKAFIFLNIRQNYLSLKFFTDKSLIEGLKKGNWNRGDDRSGSETFRIEDENDLNWAIDFAKESFKIASQAFGEK